MESIDLSSIDLDNTCFHFTSRENFHSISERGLVAKIGKHAEGIENSPKTFFAKGVKSALKIADVWIKWYIYKTEYIHYTADALSPQEYFEKYAKFKEDFISGALYTKENQQECFNYFSDFMQNNIYFVLDLEEGKDYSLSDIDEVKQKLLERGDEKILSVMYGGLTTINGNKYSMESWNMHTKTGSIVDRDKIKLLRNGQSVSALDILSSMYDKVKNEDLNLPHLESFFKYRDKKLSESEEEPSL